MAHIDSWCVRTKNYDFFIRTESRRECCSFLFSSWHYLFIGERLCHDGSHRRSHWCQVVEELQEIIRVFYHSFISGGGKTKTHYEWEILNFTWLNAKTARVLKHKIPYELSWGSLFHYIEILPVIWKIAIELPESFYSDWMTIKS